MATKFPMATKILIATKVLNSNKSSNGNQKISRGFGSYVIWAYFFHTPIPFLRSFIIKKMAIEKTKTVLKVDYNIIPNSGVM